MDDEQFNLPEDALVRRHFSLEFTIDGATEDELAIIANNLQAALLACLSAWHPSSARQSDRSVISIRLEQVTAYSSIGENPEPEVFAAVRASLPSGMRLVRGHGASCVESLAPNR